MRIRAALVTLALAAGGAVCAAPAAHASGTSFMWIGGTAPAPNQGDGHSWTDPKNWSPQRVPGNGDSVTIAPPAATECYAHVDSVPTGITLANFAMSGSVDCLASISGGSLSVSGSFALHSALSDTPITLLASSTGTISPAANGATELDANLTVDGALDLVGNVGSGSPDHSLFMQAGTRLTIAKGGTMTTSGENAIVGTSCCVSPAHLVNNGTIVDVDTLYVEDVQFDHNGTLNVPGKSSVVESWGGLASARSGATYIGSGTYRATGPSFLDTLTGTQHLGKGFRFVLGGGTQPYASNGPNGDEELEGNFTLTGGGTFDWVGGYLVGHVTVKTAGGIAVGGNAEDKAVGAGPKNSASRVVLDAPTTFAAGSSTRASYVNVDDGSRSSMTFADRTTVAGDVEFYHGTYLNTGSLTAVGSAKHPVYFAATGLTNVGTFTVTGATKIDNDLVQKAGKTVVAAGAVLTEVGSSSSVKIRGGRLDGAGRIKASVSVSGAQVRPGGTKVGTLTVYGSYSGSSSSTLLLDIAKSGADRLAVHGSTSLRGRVIGANSASLGKGTKRTVVTSTGSLSVHPTCVGTTGSGSASRHWTAAASRHALALVLVAGRPKSC